MIDKKVLNSPIRWAGSKKKILNELLTAFVDKQDNYIECFLGSGVVLINVLKNNHTLKYKNFYVNDINSNIISFYLLLKNKPDYLIKHLKKYSNKYNNYESINKKIYYYELRDKFNKEKNLEVKAIIFYILMKTGFNGVYRENKQGKFNVPYGRKEKININESYLKEVSLLIQNVEFYNLDYKSFMDKMKTEGKIKNSFMYFDPPYIPDDLLVSQKQELYTNDMFNHIDFVNEVINLKCKYIMISMAESKQADQIYKKFTKNNMKEILRTINPIKLFSSNEIAYTNYKIKVDKERF